MQELVLVFLNKRLQKEQEGSIVIIIIMNTYHQQGMHWLNIESFDKSIFKHDAYVHKLYEVYGMELFCRYISNNINEIFICFWLSSLKIYAILYKYLKASIKIWKGHPIFEKDTWYFRRTPEIWKSAKKHTKSRKNTRNVKKSTWYLKRTPAIWKIHLIFEKDIQNLKRSFIHSVYVFYRNFI